MSEKNPKPSDSTTDTVESGEVSLDELKARIGELEAENETLRDKTLRVRAEFDNFRRRKQREFEEFASLANESLMEDLLPVLDDFKLLISNADESSDVSGLIDGARLIQQKFTEILKRRGLAEVEAEGQPFNPDVHEALLEQPSADAEPGTVLTVHQPGYMLGSRLLRPARVIVAADPEGN